MLLHCGKIFTLLLAACGTRLRARADLRVCSRPTSCWSWRSRSAWNSAGMSAGKCSSSCSMVLAVRKDASEPSSAREFSCTMWMARRPAATPPVQYPVMHKTAQHSKPTVRYADALANASVEASWQYSGTGSSSWRSSSPCSWATGPVSLPSTKRSPTYEKRAAALRSKGARHVLPAHSASGLGGKQQTGSAQDKYV